MTLPFSGQNTLIEPVRLQGKPINYIFAYDGDNMVRARRGDNIIYGGEGNDAIVGEEGDDYINGGSGNNVIDGGLVDDLLIGGDGVDYIIDPVQCDTDRVGSAGGNDTVNVRDDDGRATVNCGVDRDDTVKADRGDNIANNCEIVRIARR